MQQEKFIIASKMDKTPLSVLMVTPDGAPKGLVQFSHGMAEHKERYLRVMCLLAAEGYASIIHDHRGHGESVRAQQDLGYFYSGRRGRRDGRPRAGERAAAPALSRAEAGDGGP